MKKKFTNIFVKYNLLLIFILTGMVQMLLARLLGVHDGLEHMQFKTYWGFISEGLCYSLCHVGIYHWFKNQNRS